MLNELISHLQKEWSILSSAPFTFVITLILGGLVAFLAMNWAYEARFKLLQDRLLAKQDSLLAKDDQLAEYRERLHLTPASRGGFSRLTHAELKQKALGLVQQIRTFLVKHETENRKVSDSKWQQMVMAKTEEEKQRLWNEHTNISTQFYLRLNSEYNQQYKVDAILLRDEILSRLTKDSKNERSFHMYEHPTNPIGMGMVADDLERLAKSLL